MPASNAATSLPPQYGLTHRVVPSDLIARKYEAELSPATVRNELAALEEAGLIAQPHTSAGRVPTDRGYRYFVELLQKEERELAPAERRALRQQFHLLAGSGADSSKVIGPSRASGRRAGSSSRRRPTLRRF